MTVKHKGSSYPDLVTAQEAAEMLSVAILSIRKMTRQGLLTPVFAREANKPNQIHYKKQEIARLAEFKTKKVDIFSVGFMATRALAMSEENERKLDELCLLLGLKNNRLEFDEESVISLHIKTEEVLNELELHLSGQEIFKWAQIFICFSEEYLRTVEQFTDQEDPWELYLNLARRLCEEAPIEQFAYDKSLQTIYGYLEISRKHLRQVSYFYMRSRNTIKETLTKFPDMEGGIDEVMISLLYMH